MYKTTGPTTAGGAPSGNWNYGMAQSNMRPVRKGRPYLGGSAGHFFFGLGALLWLIGAALEVASQPRFFVPIVARPPFLGSPAPDFSAGNFVGFYVCTIIGSAFWVIGALLHLIGAYAEVAAVKLTLGLRAAPGVVRLITGGAWFQLIGTVIILVGSAVFAAADLGGTSGGSILWMIGFAFWFWGATQFFALWFAVHSMAALMPDMTMRYRAWYGTMANLGVFISLVFFVLGSILFIAQIPPGSYLVGGLLFLFASITMMLSYWAHSGSMYAHYVDVFPFVMAASAPVGAGAAGMGAGTAMAAGAGAGAATGAMATKTAYTDTRPVSGVPTSGAIGAAPVASATTTDYQTRVMAPSAGTTAPLAQTAV